MHLLSYLGTQIFSSILQRPLHINVINLIFLLDHFLSNNISPTAHQTNKDLAAFYGHDLYPKIITHISMNSSSFFQPSKIKN